MNVRCCRIYHEGLQAYEVHDASVASFIIGILPSPYLYKKINYIAMMHKATSWQQLSVSFLSAR